MRFILMLLVEKLFYNSGHSALLWRHIPHVAAVGSRQPVCISEPEIVSWTMKQWFYDQVTEMKWLMLLWSQAAGLEAMRNEVLSGEMLEEMLYGRLFEETVDITGRTVDWKSLQDECSNTFSLKDELLLRQSQ